MASHVTQLELAGQPHGEIIKRHMPLRPFEANRELFRVRSSRLAELFPDELVINEKTIVLVHRDFLFSTSEVLAIKDIGRVVHIDTAFFDSLRILGKNTAHELVINGLYRKQAMSAERLLDTLVLIDQAELEMPYWLQVDPHGELLLVGEGGHRIPAPLNQHRH